MNNKLIFIILLLFTACKYDKVQPACSIPESVSFSRDLEPIFTGNCALANCHSGSHPQYNLNLSTPDAYASLTQPGKGYVDTINPKFSILYTMLTSSSTPMPPTGKLDDCKINTILKWIEQKAKNN